MAQYSVKGYEAKRVGHRSTTTIRFYNNGKAISAAKGQSIALQRSGALTARGSAKYNGLGRNANVTAVRTTTRNSGHFAGRGHVTAATLARGRGVTMKQTRVARAGLVRAQGARVTHVSNGVLKYAGVYGVTGGRLRSNAARNRAASRHAPVLSSAQRSRMAGNRRRVHGRFA